MTEFNQPSSNNRPLIPIDALTEIARQQLDIETLEERGRDALDFYDCAVWSIKAALKESYLLVQRSSLPYASEPSDDAGIARDLRIDLLEQLAQTASTDAERFVAHTSWTTEDPIATLRAFADSSVTTALTPKLAEAAQALLRRLRIDDRA